MALKEFIINRNKGQATVEFALIALLFFTFVFALSDLAVMFFVNLTIQHAVREGTRYAITGGSGDRRALLIQSIRNNANGLYDKNALSEKDPTVSLLSAVNSANFANYSGSALRDTGKSDQIIIVSLNYAWPLLTPILKPFFAKGLYSFNARATMKNEIWGN